jgi:hypothetical protein
VPIFFFVSLMGERGSEVNTPNNSPDVISIYPSPFLVIIADKVVVLQEHSLQEIPAPNIHSGKSEWMMDNNFL